MKKSEWSNEQLEELLGKLPEIKDERNPQEIYQNISLKMNKSKRVTWVMPTAASAAAILLLFILLPNLIDWKDSANESLEMAKDQSSSSADHANLKQKSNDQSTAESAIQEETKQFSVEPEVEESHDSTIDEVTVVDQSTAVYTEDIEGNEVLTYAIPDKNVQNVIPVSIVVPKQNGKSKFDLFVDNMKYLKENEWGLSDYYPLNAALTMDKANSILTVDVPANHPYAMSSTTENILSQVLENTMDTLNIEKTKLMTDGQTGIEFNHFGWTEEFTPVKELGHYAYYFYYPNGTDSTPFIVPYRYDINSVDEAFEAMKMNIEEYELKASIPDDIDFETEKTSEKELIIEFTPDSEVVNDEATLHTIEAILLTAKEFDFKSVKLENADVDKIGKFNLKNELTVPIAGNKRLITQ